MTKVFLVAGDNGLGNSGSMILGCYPTLELANARLAVCKAALADACSMGDDWEEGEPYCEYMYVLSFEVGSLGSDLSVDLD
jgi:hypothetical protein